MLIVKLQLILEVLTLPISDTIAHFANVVLLNETLGQWLTFNNLILEIAFIVILVILVNVSLESLGVWFFKLSLTS